MSLAILLDVVIGLILVFALFSLLCTVLLELVSGYLNRRGRMLETALYEIFDNAQRPPRPFFNNLLIGNEILPAESSRSDLESSLARQIMNQGAIRAHFEQSRLPSELAPEIIGDVVLKLAEKKSQVSPITDDYKAALLKLGGTLRSLLTTIAPEADLKRIEIRNRIARFYEDAMERIKGRYKRTTQAWLLCIGAFVALLFNVNAIRLADSIANDAELRQRLVLVAEDHTRLEELQQNLPSLCEANPEYCADVPANIAVSEARLQKIQSEIDALDLPIGWCSREAAEAEALQDGLRIESNARPNSWPQTVNPNDTRPAQPPGVDQVRKVEEAQKALAAVEIAEKCPIWRLNLSERGEAKEAYGIYDGAIDFLGVLLTALAISLGAPFWFDLLNRLVKLRAAGAVRGSERTSGSEGPAGDDPTSSATVTVDVKGPSDGSGEGDIARSLTQFEKSLSADDIIDVQAGLGFGLNERTGKLDEKTRQAIRIRQEQLQRSPTGQLDPDLFRLLVQSD